MGWMVLVPGTPFPIRLKQLAADNDTSISRLYDDVQWIGEGTKPSKAQIDKAMTGKLPVRRDVMQMFARHLGLDPAATFDEERLAVARDLLDERVVGLDQALSNLDQIETATRNAARSPGRREAARPASNPKPTTEDQTAQKKKRGA